MMFLALKTEDGRITGKIAFYCQMLGISRQGFYKYLANKDRPWKYQDLAQAMEEIVSEDECNDTYGRSRMYQALLLKQPEGVRIPSERTVYRVMNQMGLSHRPKRNHKSRSGIHEIGGSAETGFPCKCPIGKMYYRHHGDPGVQWKTVCICDFRLL